MQEAATGMRATKGDGYRDRVQDKENEEGKEKVGWVYEKWWEQGRRCGLFVRERDREREL